MKERELICIGCPMGCPSQEIPARAEMRMQERK